MGLLPHHIELLQSPLRPILSLPFADHGRLNSRITYTGGDNGTFFDSAGVLQTSGSDEARFTHDPATGTSLGLLIEEARTNIVLQSEDLGTTWSLTVGPSLTVNQDEAPDGTTTGDRISWIAADDNISQDITTGLSADTDVTFSAWIKQISGSPADSDLRIILFGDVIAGLANDIGSDIDGTFQRFPITVITNGAPTTITAQLRSLVTQVISYWGEQVELGDFPTSYIKTTTGTVERTADVATDTSPVVPKTWLVKGRTALGSGTQVLGQYDDGDENERIRLERNSSNEIHLIVTDGGVDQCDLNLGTVANDTDLAVAVRIIANDFAGSLDGAALVTDTSGTVPTVTIKRFGRDSTGNYWNSTIALEKGWETGLPNGTLQHISM